MPPSGSGVNAWSVTSRVASVMKPRPRAAGWVQYPISPDVGSMPARSMTEMLATSSSLSLSATAQVADVPTAAFHKMFVMYARAVAAVYGDSTRIHHEHFVECRRRHVRHLGRRRQGE